MNQVEDWKCVLRPCLVVGVKEFVASEIKLLTKEQLDEEEKMEMDDESQGQSLARHHLTKDDIFVCESLYSNSFKYFRKLINKKWSPLALIYSQITPLSINELFNVQLVKRNVPLMLTRSYLNETAIQLLVKEINERLAYKVNKLALKLFR
jgi:hypothetical protein